jgi:hypothetical protein
VESIVRNYFLEMFILFTVNKSFVLLKTFDFPVEKTSIFACSEIFPSREQPPFLLSGQQSSG